MTSFSVTNRNVRIVYSASGLVPLSLWKLKGGLLFKPNKESNTHHVYVSFTKQQEAQGSHTIMRNETRIAMRKVLGSPSFFRRLVGCVGFSLTFLGKNRLAMRILQAGLTFLWKGGVRIRMLVLRSYGSAFPFSLVPFFTMYYTKAMGGKKA